MYWSSTHWTFTLPPITQAWSEYISLQIFIYTVRKRWILNSFLVLAYVDVYHLLSFLMMFVWFSSLSSFLPEILWRSDMDALFSPLSISVIGYAMRKEFLWLAAVFSGILMCCAVSYFFIECWHALYSTYQTNFIILISLSLNLLPPKFEFHPASSFRIFFTPLCDLACIPLVFSPMWESVLVLLVGLVWLGTHFAIPCLSTLNSNFLPWPSPPFRFLENYLRRFWAWIMLSLCLCLLLGALLLLYSIGSQ